MSYRRLACATLHAVSLLAASVSIPALLIGTANPAQAQLAGADGGDGGNGAGLVGGAGGTGGLAGDGSFTGGTGGVGGVNGGGGAGGGPAGGQTGPIGQGTGTGGGPDSGGGGGRSNGAVAAGGGGGGGGRGATVSTTMTNTTTITGGDGGNGGNAQGGGTWAGGGGGGGGGAGVVLDGTSITNNGAITGGRGGNGGVGAGAGYSPSLDDGTGGTGGSGIVVNTTTGATIVNNGSITGGNGGTGNGPQGAAGVGISGQNLTIVNSGTIAAGTGSGSIDALRFTGGANTLTLTNATSGLTGNIAIQAGSLDFAQPTDVTVSNAIIGAGSISKSGAGTLTLTGNNTYTGGTTVSGGTLVGNVASIRGALVNNAAVVFNQTTNATFTGAISGSGSLSKEGVGTLTLTGVNTATGPIFVRAGTLAVTGGNAIGNASKVSISSGATLAIGQSETIGSLSGDAGGSLTVAAGQILTVQGGDASPFAGTISGAGGVTQNGAGTTTLSGTNTYTGATSITNGTLVVDGSIASSSGLTVGTGGTVAGSGTLPSTTVFGTISPGNSPGTLTVNGNLTLNAGSTYVAEVQGAVADRINVTGTAKLAGTLRLVALGGSYSFNSAYTLLSATGGASGSFGTVDTTGSFGAGVTTTVSYTATEVLLTLTPAKLAALGVTAPANAASVAWAIDNAVANGGDPSSLFAVYNLSAAEIPAAVNQLSGELHSAAPAMATVAADRFLRSMLDPALSGRLGGTGEAGPGAAAFSGLARKGADQVGPSRLDAPFYSVWGAAFGSYGRTDGNAAIGSARREIEDAHLATGVDVRLMPGTVVGIAVAGGKARASLPGLLGKIDADVFQAGLYGMTRLGPLKLDGALSYARLENDVSRAVPILGTTLSSSYATTAWSGRLQASAALLNWAGLSLSPLAAIQATRARSPAAVETNWAGTSAAALVLGKRSDITARSELGFQIDADAMLGTVPVTGHLRAAWAHYFKRDADLTASLIGLPGATFAATGARIDRNAALVSAGISARLSQRVSIGLSLDGELAGNSHRLGGTAQLKVSF